MPHRTFVRPGTLVTLSGSLWHSACASRAGGPYGDLAPPDESGLAVPYGFTGRVVARSGERVEGLTWHSAPDGGACFPHADAGDDGWIYVSNSNVPLVGGVSALRFGPDGTVRGAYRILSGTNLNRAGGATPWHTWLSCEETARGRIFECDPYGLRAAMPRLAMGRFRHEAVACDPQRQVLYLTEDEPDGCFYRFRPEDWGDLTTGALDVLVVHRDKTQWREVPHPAALAEPTRDQVPGAMRFNRGQDCHYVAGLCYFTTKGDGRVWAYDAVNETLAVIYDAAHSGSVVRAGDLYVSEDVMEISTITPDGAVAPFARLYGHERSELAGLAFSPYGDRLYFSSQRGMRGAASGGITYEVMGPFRA
jgi:hypothetical protein